MGATKMPFQDLREYLGLLETRGELVQVEREVDPSWEIGLICRELMDRQGPAAMFRNARGCSLPVVVNIFANRGRVALALGIEERALIPHWLQALEQTIPPQLVDAGPCQEIVRTDGDLLADLPRITWNPDDGGPYLTFGLAICKDPETGQRNMGIYRCQIKDNNRIGMNAKAPAHAGVALAKAELQGHSLPIAIAVGADPSLYLASQAPRGFNGDEVALAGSLRGEPVPMVKCRTVDLEVPATAELVLEGYYLANTVEMEGPFGEFTGYYSGAAPRGLIELTAVTRRRDALYLATYEGKPPTNTHVIHAAAREPVWYTQLKQDVCPTIRDINVTYAGCAALHVIVSMKQLKVGQARNVGLDLIKNATIKHVIVVDDDIDVRDPNAVEWAIATRVQADRDVIVIPDLAGMGLDPSQPKFPSGLSAKMIIDATLPMDGSEALIALPAEGLAAVRERWTQYGFPDTAVRTSWRV
jgi:2,5-furandicarboxylate decarboxylase 1